MGKKLSEGHKLILSESHKGNKNPMFGRVGTLSPQWGIKRSKETIDKIRMARLKQPSPFKGKHHTIENKLKLSTSSKEYYKTHDNPRKNIILSPEEKCRLYDQSKTFYLNHSSPFKGCHHDAESIKKMKLGQKLFYETHVSPRKGKHHTEKTKEKMRIGCANRVNKFKDTAPELKVQNELISRNIQFEKHKPIVGIPDVFIEPNICIFVDGNLYHAHPDIYKPDEIVPKINMLASKKWEYDKNITDKLIKLNYIVLRFWEKDIHKDIKIIGNIIQKSIGDFND